MKNVYEIKLNYLVHQFFQAWNTVISSYVNWFHRHLSTQTRW